MADIFDLDRLLTQMVPALGVALMAGNAYALFIDHRGVGPDDGEGEILRPRAWFLPPVGMLIAR
jgi:uncharacterized membrane protein YqaE (UPF0057 family)